MISGRDLADLERAKNLLEKESVTVKLAAVFGDLSERIVRSFPRTWRRHIEDACLVGLEKSWEFSATTVSAPGTPSEPEKRHRQYAILSGAVGGVGISTLFAELPVTTVIMMRAVADIAKSEGEDFRQFETRVACLQVLALGGGSDDTESETTAYYASRTLLEQPLHESTRYIAKKGAAGMGAPFAVQIAAKIAVHYQTWLSARTAAAAVPLAGAAMGAGINIVYLNYLQDKARGHFIVRRLERKYGADVIEREYTAARCGDRAAEVVHYHSPDE
ncbi:MAG: EcsC family protein, partial [Candidatus Electrothrix sp. AUS1_2]|nr:EcsC family protein [Candidatus Electrothrix sp. AUS1_2]